MPGATHVPRRARRSACHGAGTFVRTRAQAALPLERLALRLVTQATRHMSECASKLRDARGLPVFVARELLRQFASAAPARPWTAAASAAAAAISASPRATPIELAIAYPVHSSRHSCDRTGVTRRLLPSKGACLLALGAQADHDIYECKCPKDIAHRWSHRPGCKCVQCKRKSFIQSL